MKMRTSLLTAAIAFSLPAFAVAQETDKAAEKQAHKEHKQVNKADTGELVLFVQEPTTATAAASTEIR